MVYYHDVNANRIKPWNVFNHNGFKKEVIKILRGYYNDRNGEESYENTGYLMTRSEFAELIRKELLYYFWSKCEYEVIIKEWAGNPCEVKVDVYGQVYMNFSAFIDYLLSTNVWFNLLEAQKGA